MKYLTNKNQKDGVFVKWGFIKSRFLEKLLLKTSSGFTLIETLVAITILLITLVGPMEIASKGLQTAFYARDEIAAFYLAQEGLEYVRNGRDSVFLLDLAAGIDDNWLRGFDECDISLNQNGCIIVLDDPGGFVSNDIGGGFSEDAVQECDQDMCEDKPLRFDETDRVYGYDSNDPISKFTRTIKIELIGNNEAEVVSTVSWDVGVFFASRKVFTLRERLYNWQRN